MGETETSPAPLPFLRPLSPSPCREATEDPPVVWVGPALGLSSYSIHTRQSILWLRDAGVRVEAASVGRADPAYLRTMDMASFKR